MANPLFLMVYSMPDKVKPLKVESTPDGDETDLYPTETDPSEDYIATKGIAFEDSDNQLIDILDNEIRFKDNVTGSIKLSELIYSGTGLTPESHRALRQAVHVFADTGYYEVTYNSGQVTNETWWSNDTKVLKVRTIDYTYAGSKCTKSVLKIYDTGGSVVETLTEDYNYTGSRLDSIDYTLS